MPSPIIHSAAGYALYRTRRQEVAGRTHRIGRLPVLMVATVALSSLPDLDAIPGFLTGDFSGFHNNVTHSLAFGLVAAAVVGGLVWAKQRSGFLTWFVTTLLCYELHVLLDLFTVGRGVMLLWPLTADRFSSPVLLFYGVHWSEGLLSIKHLWTVLSELAFVGAVALGVQAWRRLAGRSTGNANGRFDSDRSGNTTSLVKSETTNSMAGARHE